MLRETRKDLLKQMNYILKEKSSTEERIINGTALLRKTLIEYNKLLEFAKSMKESFFDLYFKIKMNEVSKNSINNDDDKVDDDGNKYPYVTEKDLCKNLPITDKELLTIRGLDKLSKRSLIKEIGDVNESELLLETFHDLKHKVKPEKN